MFPSDHFGNVDFSDEKIQLTADAEFALRLEPQNQELKKQYAEAKSLYDKVKLLSSVTHVITFSF